MAISPLFARKAIVLMSTIYQMTLDDCRAECRRLQALLQLVRTELLNPYDDVVEIELRVQKLAEIIDSEQGSATRH